MTSYKTHRNKYYIAGCSLAITIKFLSVLKAIKTIVTNIRIFENIMFDDKRWAELQNMVSN